MSIGDEQLEDETPVFTQKEAYVLAYGVAHFLLDEDEADDRFEEITAFIDEAIPKVLA